MTVITLCFTARVIILIHCTFISRDQFNAIFNWRFHSLI